MIFAVAVALIAKAAQLALKEWDDGKEERIERSTSNALKVGAVLLIAALLARVAGGGFAGGLAALGFGLVAGAGLTTRTSTVEVTGG